jgi:hypothetical protein
VFGNEESENNDENLGSYEPSSDSCSSVKRRRSSNTQDEHYVPEEEVYEH